MIANGIDTRKVLVDFAAMASTQWQQPHVTNNDVDAAAVTNSHAKQATTQQFSVRLHACEDTLSSVVNNSSSSSIKVISATNDIPAFVCDVTVTCLVGLQRILFDLDIVSSDDINPWNHHQQRNSSCSELVDVTADDVYYQRTSTIVNIQTSR
jgi:hypothetical protein